MEFSEFSRIFVAPETSWTDSGRRKPLITLNSRLRLQQLIVAIANVTDNITDYRHQRSKSLELPPRPQDHIIHVLTPVFKVNLG